MARNTATSQRIIGTNPDGLGYPNTLFCRAKAPDVTAQRYAFQLANPGASDDSWTVGFRGDTGGDPIQYRLAAGGAGIVKVVNSASSYSAATWYSLAIRAISTTDYDLFVNGVRADGSDPAGTPANTTRYVIGAFISSSSYFDHLNDDVCDCAAWSTDLTDDEITSLQRDYPPYRIRPQNLIFNARLVREVIETKLGIVLTDSGTTVSVHPRSYGF
jgi:hypothetical protein